jgi:hypothetical protein
MATESQVQALIDDGWSVVPIRKSEKRPDAKDWVNTEFVPGDFGSDHNIGVKNGEKSGWRIDVDCDDDHARHAAMALLPKTKRHGRPGNPDSHFWYISENCETATFKHLDGSMLIEVRSNGTQTVVPPSTHASGEPIRWSGEDSMLHMEPDELKSIVACVATTALLVKFWPQNAGGRHSLAGDIAGALIRCGVPPTSVVQIIMTAAIIAGDEQPRDRAAMAQSTVDRFGRGLPVTGAPKLAESIEGTPALLGRIATWFGKVGEDQLDMLNAKHFVVRVGKDMAVGTEDEHGVDLMSFEAFNKLYCNQYVGKKRMGQFWLDHPQRRQFDRLVFAPPHAPIEAREGDYNVWRGFAVAPSTEEHPERRCRKYFRHIHDVIAHGRPELYEWIVDFLADAVKRPGSRVGKALAIRGKQGTGKSLFVEAFGALFGKHFICVSDREQIVGKFNAHLSGKVIVFADEAIWGGRREDIGILKHLVTQTAINIQRKGIDIVSELNCIRLLMATNESWTWPAGNHERRGVIVDVDPDIRSAEYFRELVAEICAPEFLPSLLACLISHEVDYTRLRAGVQTKALLEQQEFTADPVQQWWKQILEDGVWPRMNEWPAWISHEAVYEEFTDVMGSQRGAGYTHRGTRMQVTRRLMDLLPKSATNSVRKVRINVNEKVRGMTPEWQERHVRVTVLPSLDACRRAYDAVSGFPQDWPEPVVVTEPDLPLGGEAA